MLIKCPGTGYTIQFAYVISFIPNYLPMDALSEDYK